MKSLYAACLSRLGLSQSEAAALHDVRLDTVKNWSSGRRIPPQATWDELREVEAQIVERADALLAIWEEQGCPPVDLTTDEADHAMMMASADFVLNSDCDVHTGQSDATLLARQARRPN